MCLGIQEDEGGGDMLVKPGSPLKAKMSLLTASHSVGSQVAWSGGRGVTGQQNLMTEKIIHFISLQRYKNFLGKLYSVPQESSGLYPG